MQARAAYIRSFGTTGILVAAALLMLATVGALVAYDGWPDRTGGDPVASVPVQTPRDVRAARSVAAPSPAAARLIAPAAAAATAGTPVPGLVRDVSARSQSTVGLVKVPAPPAGSTELTPQPAPSPATPDAQPVPVGSPQPPSPPLPISEPVPGTVQGGEEIAYGVLGTALPQAEEPAAQPPLGIDLGELTLPLAE